MALIKNVKEFVQSVATIVETDTAVIDQLFPTVRLNRTEEIQYDSATIEGVSPEYRSFSETAKVISKGGKDVVSLKPVSFNNAISKEEIDAQAAQFGQNEYGEGTIDSEAQSALTGIGKHHLNAMVGRKKVVYEALTTHRITGGYIGVNGKEDIVFNVPAANREAFNGTAPLYWSNASSVPVTDIHRMYDLMKIKPDRIIMNNTCYTNFYGNAQVLTMDNNTTGKKRNFVVNEAVPAGAKFFKAGTIMDKGMTIDVYVENEQRNTGSGYTPFLPNGYVIYASPMGEMHFGGIPKAVAGGITRIAAEFDVEEILTQNPPQHLLQYRTAFIPVLKNGEAYGVQKVEA